MRALRTRERIVIASACLVLTAGCQDLPGRPDPADRPPPPGAVGSFEHLYSVNCAGCHGESGADGPAPPLNDPLFASFIPEQTLLSVMHTGRAGTPMPSFSEERGGSLTDQQMQVLADGIKQTWGGSPQADDVPAYAVTASSGDAARGEKVFARACAGCHGVDGRAAERDLMGQAINVPAFLELISDQALRRIIITGRSDLGMPDYAATDGRPDDFDPLTSSEIDDLVALLAHWRNSTMGDGSRPTTNQPDDSTQ